LKDYPDEAPSLRIHAFAESRFREVPHQKLIVIDGLLAFKGSSNLTLSGWRKADKGLDIIEVVTDVGEVIRLHNEYFSPLWARSSEIMDSIAMEKDFFSS
jgi:hypothetical protein